MNRSGPLPRYPYAPGAWSSIAPGAAQLDRTGLRRTPWAGSVPGITTSPVPAKSAARKGSATGSLIPDPPSEFTPKVKRLVRRRAGRGDPFDAECEACSAWLGIDAGEFQHRDARGMGGSKDPVTNSAANAVLLCGCAALGTGCHGLCENRDDDQNHMNGMGFWLKEGQDPRTEPIMLHGAGGGGLTLWLAEDGIGYKGTGYLLQRPDLELAS